VVNKKSERKREQERREEISQVQFFSAAKERKAKIFFPFLILEIINAEVHDRVKTKESLE
jgi:hypothetical protein